MDYKKLIGESVKDYKIRLCSNKDIYNLSFQKIAELINFETGENKDESTYRKWWNAYKEGVLDTEKKLLDNDEVLKEYESKRIEAEKARIRFFDQRTAYTKNIRNEARFDELKDIILDKLSIVEPYERNKKEVFFSKNDLLIGLNDIHFGSNIDNNWNKYNPDVAKERLDLYLSNIISIKNTHKSTNCYVCANGDLISGNIHPTIQISNKENVVKQIMGVSELISWFLSSFLFCISP